MEPLALWVEEMFGGLTKLQMDSNLWKPLATVLDGQGQGIWVPLVSFQIYLSRVEGGHTIIVIA